MQTWLSIYDNFHLLVINFISSFYFPDPELHLLPVYPSAQITTRIIHISNTTGHKSLKKKNSPDACHKRTNIAVGGLIINSCFEFARSLCFEFRSGVFIFCDFRFLLPAQSNFPLLPYNSSRSFPFSTLSIRNHKIIRH